MTYCTIVIPNLDRHARPVDPAILSRCVRDTLDALIEWAGGCTILRGVGHWRSAAGVMMIERVRILCCYAEESEIRSREVMYQVAWGVRVAMDQESVLWTVNHQHYFAGSDA